MELVGYSGNGLGKIVDIEFLTWFGYTDFNIIPYRRETPFYQIGSWRCGENLARKKME